MATVVVQKQEVIQAHPARTDADGTVIDAGTKYRFTGTVDGAGPFVAEVWVEVYAQTQAAGYAGDAWAKIVSDALVLAADPPSQVLGGASLVGQTI